MQKDQYKKLGFKCGLEVHQQLDTNKLFCNCPSLVNDPSPIDTKVMRRLRPTIGETGEIDVAAKHEFEKNKFFIYEACSSSSCLVDLDEEPPHSVNKDALAIVLQVAKSLNAEIVDEIQVMRKIVIDGSNTTGFQRTALVARNGFIETSKGKVKVPSICLEEEAAKKISNNEVSVTYRLDRLGVPLIEVTTDPDIIDPEHAKETAEKIGMVLRSTGKVKRGIGSVRQDINMSIKDGQRTEIKGFQDLKSIPKVMENEIKRQSSLLKSGKKVPAEVRKAEPDFTTKFLRPMPGAARMYPETDVLPVKVDKYNIEDISLIDDKIDAVHKKHKIDKGTIKKMHKSKIENDSTLEFFDELVSKFKDVKPALVAETLISYGSEVMKQSKEADPSKIKKDHLSQIFEDLNKGKINKNHILQLLSDISHGKKLDTKKYHVADLDDLEAEIKKIIDEKPGLNIGAYMGLVMQKFKGKVDGKKASEIIKKLLG
jgi:Glu-tRNA(Gln) amidotransferase subunit E-like FAD-binding protein